MTEINPPKILIFLIGCFTCLALISIVFPSRGIVVQGKTILRFPTWESVFDAEQEKADITDILAMEVLEDTIQAPVPVKVDLSKYHGAIMPDSGIEISVFLEMQDSTLLDNFFAALRQAGNEGKNVRIMHYGDSQIEVDRITGYVRGRLQANFGGSGPGYLSIMPVAEAMAYNNSWSAGWERYTAFTAKDKRVLHRSFGPAAAISRYAPVADSNTVFDIHYNAWLKIVNTKKAGGRLANISTARLYYGNLMSPVSVEVYADGALVKQDSLRLNGSMHSIDIDLSVSPANLEYKFSGNDSPDFYGISLEGNPGVLMDNLALRGSSGDFFNRLDLNQLNTFYDHVGVDLFILQFGGNTLPYLRDAAHASSYAASVAAQIRTLKRLCPEACVVFIGPSDKGIKEGIGYVSHPLISSLNDALKSAVMAEGAAYYDMYAAMGGNNSMTAWVDAGLAGSDYTHFSPQGAKKIAVLFYHALVMEYNNYIIRNN